jgi:hypothetical protein
VTAETRDNPSFEKSKRDKLLAWKKQRVDAAKLFKSEAARGLPIAAQYKLEKGKEVGTDLAEKCSWDTACMTKENLIRAVKKWPDRKATFQQVQPLLDSNLKDWVPVKLTSLDKRPLPTIDGFFHPLNFVGEGMFWESSIPYPLPNQLGILQATQIQRVYPPHNPPFAKVANAEDPACKKGQGVTHQFAWTPKTAANAMMRSVVVVNCGNYEAREGYYPAGTWQMLTYNHDGLLDTVIGPGYVAVYNWGKGSAGPLVASAEMINMLGYEDSKLTQETPTATP